MNVCPASLITSVLLGTALLVSCVPTKLKQKPVVKPVAEPDSLVLLAPDVVKEKITQLELMLMLKDTTLSKEDVLPKLFNLLVHVNNPEPDYRKAASLADSLAATTRARRYLLYYQSWGAVLRKHQALTGEKDSLETVIKEINTKNQSLRYATRKRTKQIDSLSQYISDSLTVIIREQKEKIEKLQELDLQMEKQRSEMQ